mmetsp:Transcript_44120/g.172088  ORF Transcript_44120/g.172088 Transcript_44120/m.172088 type:complete len:84 (-) Transcript_44120:1490-1741(-)
MNQLSATGVGVGVGVPSLHCKLIGHCLIPFGPGGVKPGHSLPVGCWEIRRAVSKGPTKPLNAPTMQMESRSRQFGIGISVTGI